MKPLLLVLCLTLTPLPVLALDEDWYELISPVLPAFLGPALSLIPSNPPDHAAISADIPAQNNPNKVAITDANYNDQQRGGFDTLEMMSRAMEGFLDCVDFCLDGVSFRIRNFSTLSAAIWRHRNADFLVQTYPSQAANGIIAPLPTLPANLQTTFTAPWNEWASLIGRATYAVTSDFAERLLPPMLDSFGLDGGQTRQSHYGEQQSTNFKEADVIGHPYVLIPLLLDRSGETQPTEACDLDTGTCASTLPGPLGETADQEAADAEPDPETGESPDWLNMTPEELAQAGVDRAVEEIDNYATRVINCAYDLECVITELVDSAEFRQLFSVLDAVEQYRALISQFNGFTQLITDLSAVISGAALTFTPRIDRVLCPSGNSDTGYVRPFIPYYLSGIDPAWRNGLIDFDLQNFGFPNDPHRWRTILNPLSDDRVGANNELWGNMYPRSGFYNHTHDAKGAMVLIKRAIDIVEEDWEDPGAVRKRLRWNAAGFPPIPDDNDEPLPGHYQMIYPLRSRQCAAEPWQLDRDENVHGDFMYPGQEQRYAFNYWRMTRCLSTSRGSTLLNIDLPDICL